MSLVKVNDSNFIRDTESMALINTNQSEKDEYYNKVRALKRQKEELNEVKSEVIQLKEEISEIKSLLLKLIEKEPS
jgi:cell shape-determining protein MreC